MTSMINLRSYQREGVDRLQDDLSRFQRPAAVLATGLGKTVMFVHMIAEWMEQSGQRAMILVNRDELCNQAVDKIRLVAPHLSVGRIQGPMNEVSSDVIVASQQTLWRDNRLAALKESYDSPESGRRRVGLVIVDECHFAVSPTYLKILKAVGCFTKASGVKAVGFTATMARGDGTGLGDVWQTVSFSRSLLWGIGRDYLVDIRPWDVTVEALDLGRVKRSGNSGDFTDTSLGDALILSDAGSVTARAYRQYAADRQGITFSPTVAATHRLAEDFRDAGITSAVVEASTPRPERLRIYDDSRRGAVQVVHNCGVLTHGADFPWISCAVIKPTQSEPLFQQMVGRITRTFPGKKDGLILGIGGINSRIRTLVDLEPGAVKKVRPGESLAEAVVREAEESNAPVPAGSPAFVLKRKQVDLFAGTDTVWLRTPAGVMFIPCLDGEVILWPSGEDGLWDVRYASRTAKKWPRLHRGLSLDMAMAWGETEAEDLEADGLSLSSRAAPWRRKKAPVTSGQIQAMEALGLDPKSVQTKQAASDALSVRRASLRFDRFVTRTAKVSA